MIDGVSIGDFCKDWHESGAGKWCILYGGNDAVGCPGAKKSSDGEFYVTSDPGVCSCE